MANERSPAVEAALSALVAEIDAGRIEVYQNVLGQPYVIFRNPERPQGVFVLSHQDVRGWLAEFAWEGGHGLIRERDIDRILTFLRGRAMRKRLSEISDPAVLKLLRSEPMLAVAYEFMYEQETGRHEGTMAALWTAWRKRAVERGLLAIGRKRFPGGPQVLSRLLNHFEEALSAMGITVKIKRSNGSQVTLTRRSDASAEPSSAEASSSNSGSDNQLNTADDRLAQLARLSARKHAQDQSEERRGK